jgi:flagellar basal-body rod modification protein FlgD
MTVTAPAPVSTNTSNPSTSNTVANQQIANNFQQFLQLLTTQLQNQNPLDPLDTNQFTQQLVQFAQVEQQINMNTSLTQLIALQQTAQMTQAVGLIGTTVTVDGSTAQLSGGKANWSFSPTKPGTATINIKDSTGQIVYTTTQTVNPGEQTFSWDGKSVSGAALADGKYTISISLKDTSGQTSDLSTERSGVVDSVDMTKNPPTLSIDGQTYTMDQIRRVDRTGSVAPQTQQTPQNQIPQTQL